MRHPFCRAPTHLKCDGKAFCKVTRVKGFAPKVEVPLEEGGLKPSSHSHRIDARACSVPLAAPSVILIDLITRLKGHDGDRHRYSVVPWRCPLNVQCVQVIYRKKYMQHNLSYSYAAQCKRSVFKTYLLQQQSASPARIPRDVPML